MEFARRNVRRGVSIFDVSQVVCGRFCRFIKRIPEFEKYQYRNFWFSRRSIYRLVKTIDILTSARAKERIRLAADHFQQSVMILLLALLLSLGKLK